MYLGNYTCGVKGKICSMDRSFADFSLREISNRDSNGFTGGQWRTFGFLLNLPLQNCNCETQITNVFINT